MSNIERILIVGGGIAGLTLATALHQHGFTPELIERSPAWQAIGAGIAVQPNGMRILHALGMGAAVEQAKLHQILRAAAAAVPSRLGLSVSMLTHSDDRVSVDFSDGSTGLYDLV